ncbi:MAG: flagellar basal body rod protein FlgB [Armatimonadetes bacterium]|nr:flagellar basal body rod protein FlgB [Armatimonadota bacterium]
MLDKIFNEDLGNLQQALQRTTRRQSMLSANIANLNTPGFKRKDIDFNIVLQGANSRAAKRMQDMQDQKAQEASDRVSLRADGNNVDLEREVMSIAETQLRYEALTSVTTNYFSNLKSVIREGK